jgi:hypothetical protein
MRPVPLSAALVSTRLGDDDAGRDAFGRERRRSVCKLVVQWPASGSKAKHGQYQNTSKRHQYSRHGHAHRHDERNGDERRASELTATLFFDARRAYTVMRFIEFAFKTGRRCDAFTVTSLCASS